MGGLSSVGPVRTEASVRLDVGGAQSTSPADFAASTAPVRLSAKDRRRNCRLGVINGAIFRVGDVFIDTEMVLTWFLAQLGASNLLIGLVSPIRFGGSFLLSFSMGEPRSAAS